MRIPLDSPFSPGSNTILVVWIGRTSQLGNWRDVLRPRRLSGIYEQGRTILGEAGSGKSSLVRRIACEAFEADGWVAPQLRIPSDIDPIERTASALLELAPMIELPAAREQCIGDLLRRIETVAASGISLSVRTPDGPEAYTALTDLLVEIGRSALRQQDVMVILHVDEVQNIVDEHTRSQLLVALDDILTHEEPATAPGGVRMGRALPIAVYLTGLPGFADVVGVRTGATFARRFQTTFLGAINDEAPMTALQPFVTEGWPVTNNAGDTDKMFMEPKAQRVIVNLARGEPFLFQLAGERAWYAGMDNLITPDRVRTGWIAAAPEAEAHVQRIFDRLPAREHELIGAMAELTPEERSLTNVARKTGHAKVTDADPTARRLDFNRRIIQRGRSYRFQHRAVEAYLTSNWPRWGLLGLPPRPL